MQNLFNFRNKNNLGDIFKDISKCNKCPFNSLKKYSVLGICNSLAKIAIISDATYHIKDEHKYFISDEAVDLFRKYLLPALGINEENIYLTFVIKCSIHPKTSIKNENIRICKEYLLNELELINPDYIITLGKTPYVAFFDKTPPYDLFPAINSFKLKNKDIKIFSTYSLNYALENLKRTYLIIKDFEYFGKIINNKISINSNINYEIITKVEQLENWVKNELKDIVAVDIETASLTNPIISGIGFCCSDTKSIFVPFLKDPINVKFLKRKEIIDITIGKDLAIWSNDEWEKIRNIIYSVLENPKVKKIFHNGDYDIKVLVKNGFNVNNFYFDTMIAASLINENFSGNLKELGYFYLDFPKYQQDLMDNIKKSPAEIKDQYEYLFVPLDILAKYCATDVNITFRLHNFFINMMKNQPYENLFYKICMPLRKILTRATIRGIKINKEKVELLKKTYSEKLYELEQKIYELAGKKFNINSTEQLGDVLFRKLGLPIKKFTTTNRPSTDTSVIEELVDVHPICSYLLEYRNLMKIKTTYLEGMMSLLDKNDTLHTNFRVNGTETGRIVSSEPNLQNIPRDSDIRTIFCSREGYSLVTVDFDQAELRILAAFSKDPVLIEAYKKGEDIHLYTASKIYNKPMDKITKEERTSAKAINFGICYQMTKFGLSNRLKISLEEAQSIIDAFYKTYKYVKLWADNIREFILKNKYIYNVFGRIRRFPFFDLQKNKEGLIREGINFPIQSTCADMTSIATIRNDLFIRKKYGYENVSLLLNIHDELVYEVKDECIDEFVKDLKNSMEQPYFESDVQFTVDINVMKEWKKE